MKNNYELQSEVYSQLKEGASAESLWEFYKEQRKELKHLVGGNPNKDEYKKGIHGLLKQLETQISESAQSGPLAVRGLHLQMQSTTLAGSVLRSLIQVEPKTIPDDARCLKVYNALTRAVSRINLDACIAELPEDQQAVYNVDVEQLYGPAEVKNEDKG